MVWKVEHTLLNSPSDHSLLYTLSNRHGGYSRVIALIGDNIAAQLLSERGSKSRNSSSGSNATSLSVTSAGKTADTTGIREPDSGLARPEGGNTIWLCFQEQAKLA